MATTLAPPPTGGNKNRGPALLAIMWSEGAVALIIVVLRLYARLMIKRLGIDDWIMFFTMVRAQ